MSLFVKPESDTRVRRCNLVVGYYQGKAIIKNEENNFLYYIECEELQAPEGTYLENETLTPINTLSSIEQDILRKIYLQGE